MSIDWNKIKSNAKAKDDKQYEEMKADTSKRMAATAAAEKAAQPSVTERVGKTVTGAGKGSAAGLTNLGGVVVEGLNKVGTYLQSKKDAQQAAQDREYLAKYDQDLKDAIAAGDAKAEKAARLRINSAKNRLKTNGDMTEYYKSVGDTTTKNIYDTADALAESSQKDISRAKQGAGKAGQFLVDVGVAGTQMAGDIGLALLTGGSALAPMAARSFGSGAQEARQAGASYGQQVAYGAGSAALSAATEKIANVAGPFKKAFGGGVLDDAVAKAVEKMGGSAAGKAALSILSEGGEEIVEDLVQPILQRATYDPEAMAHYKDPDYWANTLYDGLVGGALGGIGSGVEQAGNRVRKNASVQDAASAKNGTVQSAGERTRSNTGVDATIQKGTTQATVEANTKPFVSQEKAARNDVLVDILTGKKRVEQSRLTNEQFGALADRGDIGMDASGKVYQVDPEQHIDRRTADSVSSRNMNAFQFDHPELHSYYQQAAEALIADADLSLQFPMNRSYERSMQGNKVNQSVQASAHLRQAMDETGLSRAEIIDAAQRIVHDQGQENVKAAKQVEIILDSMLTNGWSTMMGDTVGPNQAYIDAKSSIMGSQPQVQGEELPMMDGLGNANAGTVNTAFDDMQARSDTFHPVNPNSEQRIMNDQQRAPSEVPTVNPDTGKNIGKTVSTILNSPLTSPEMATQIESAVADGQFDYIPVTDKDAHLRAQQDLSNRGLQTVADSFIAKVELGQRITKNDTASAIAAYNQAVADGNHALAFDLMTAIADAAHDSAQVVQSMNLMNRLTPEGKLLTLRKYVDKLNRQNRSKPGRQAATANATQEQVDAARTNYVEQATGFRISDELAANYLMAETDAERAAAWDAITTDIANQLPSTFREKANFWRYTSMLLNPTTHVRNFLGNAIQAGARTIKNGVGAVIERAVVKDQSQRTKAIVAGKEGKDLRAFAKSQYEADQTAAMGAGKYSDASAAGINREIQEKRNVFTAKMQGRAAETISNIVPQAVHTAADAAGKAVQAVGDFNTRLLDLGDVIFNKSAYVDSFAQALQAKGVTAAEAAGGAKSDLVAQARAYAIEEAQKATYRNTTALSELLSNAGRYEGNNPIAKALSVGYDAFMPFRRTPANILTTGIDYSPVGIAKAITYDAYQVKAGNMRAADMVDHLSAGLTGSGILALGAYLAAEGLLRVRTGEDDREKDYNEDRGVQEYSLQIGDKSYTLDWAVPAAMPLYAGAAIMESAREGGSGFDAVMDAIGGISEVVLETSMLSSLNDLISNWSYADSKALYLLDRTVTSYAGQYVPTVGSKIASAMDDTVRKSYVEKGTGQLASDLGYFAQSMEKKIPGARENLQPKVDLWGNEVSNGEVGDRLLQSFLSPGYFKTVDTGDLDKELRRLAEATGSSAVYPAEVEKSFKVGGETKNLTEEEYTKYAKAVGQTRYQAVSALTGNSGYKKLTDEEKAKAVAYAYEYATVKGKQAVSGYKPGDSSFAKGAMNSVLPIDSYILYKITADKDGNGSVSGTESAKALQAMSGLTDKQRWQEWARLNDAKDKADKASAAGLTVGEYASTKEKADANGDGRVTKEEAMKALGGVKNRVDLWDIICTTSAKNPYQ